MRDRLLNLETLTETSVHPRAQAVRAASPHLSIHRQAHHLLQVDLEVEAPTPMGEADALGSTVPLKSAKPGIQILGIDRSLRHSSRLMAAESM